MKRMFAIGFVVGSIAIATFVMARGGGRYSSRGTGSSSRSTRVKGYAKQDGTYVAPANRTVSNSTRDDNYSTRGNVNPWTGKKGSAKTDSDMAYPSK